MAISVQVLDLRVIGPFVGHVEGGRERAPVRVGTSFFEQIHVQLFIEIINRVVECEHYQLWYVLGRQTVCVEGDRKRQKKKKSLVSV